VNIDRHFHHVVTITHNRAVVAVAVAAADSAVRASHSRRPGAGIGMVYLVLVFWLCGCLFVCAFACVFGMDSM